jgi:hypothetical protein
MPTATIAAATMKAAQVPAGIIDEVGSGVAEWKKGQRSGVRADDVRGLVNHAH